MSEEKEDQGDKPYEASRRKLEEARKKGEIVRSQDVVNFAVISLVLIALAVIYGSYMTDIVQDMRYFIQTSVLEREILDGQNLFVRSTRSIASVLVFLFVFPFCVLLLGLIATRQVLFTSDKIQPKLNRLSLLGNARKKFGASGLFEFTKNVVKFLILAGLISLFFNDSFILFESAITLDEHNALANIYDVAFKWLWFTLSIYVIFAMIDVLWQVQEHARKNRMSHKEMKDEHKNEEGDESIRHKRRAKAEEIATNRMLLDVPKAAVVITNPTHYAVALHWDGTGKSVPKCVAKGTDETARRIREIAMQSGVPLYRDPTTARELFAKVEIGLTIDTSHYKAVAAAIGYARRIEKRMARGR